MVNCFREISEFDDAARKGSARGSGEGDVNESLVHSTVSISPLQACFKMNIKGTFDCLTAVFCLVSLNLNRRY